MSAPDNILNFPVLETEFIRLVPTRPDDLNLICQLEWEPENSRQVMPYTHERHTLVLELADEMHLSVIEKETGLLAGFIILAGLQNPHHSLELRRIIIGQKGKGYGKQSINLVIDYCFSELKFHRLWLDAFVENNSAIKLYQSLGFKQEGVLRECWFDGKEYKSLVVMGMLEGEFGRAGIR